MDTSWRWWLFSFRQAKVITGNTFCYPEETMATATSIKLDDDLKNRLQHLAEARRRSAHWIMREAITQYVEREEKREALLRDAQHAWEDYQKTGLHLTMEEADEWLAQLEAGRDVEPPACHK